MKIGIDAHNLEYEQTGVARYLLNMLITWKDRKDDNEYILYFQNKYLHHNGPAALLPLRPLKQSR